MVSKRERLRREVYEKIKDAENLALCHITQERARLIQDEVKSKFESVKNEEMKTGIKQPTKIDTENEVNANPRDN